MTCEEAAKLNVGDLVLSRREGRKVLVEVVDITTSLTKRGSCRHCHLFTKTRRIGMPKGSNNKYPSAWDDHRRFVPVSGFLDFVEGNVFADYLEQEGFPEAAQALRKRFPLSGQDERVQS